MGHQIFYCDICGEQIRSADLESGQAFEIDHRKFCLKCGPDMLRTLPKDQFKDIFQAITTPSRHSPNVTGEGAPRTKRVRLLNNPTPSKGPWIAVGVAASILLLGLLWWGLGNSPSEPIPAPVAVKAVRPPEQKKAPPPPAQDPTPAPTPPPTPLRPPPSLPAATNKDQIAEGVLRKAQEWAAANPSDFDGAIRKFQDASFLATGTSIQAEAGKALELYRQKQREFFGAELATLEPDVMAAMKEEHFKKALDILALAKARHPSTEWQLLLGKRSREINDGAFKLLDQVKEDAREAQKRGDEEKVKQLQSRIASWGIAQFIKEFREAIGE
jgi:type IV secretory pathway VirB10-like protein